MSTATESNAWRILNQSQAQHLGDYCTLSHAIAYVGGILQVNQRTLDTPEGYAEGQARARLIAAAPAMLQELLDLLTEIDELLHEEDIPPRNSEHAACARGQHS